MSANAGEVSVELRLQLTKLQGDVARAATMMRSGLAINLGGGGGRGSGGGGSGSGPAPVGSGGGGGGVPPVIGGGGGGGGGGSGGGGGGFRLYGGGHASIGRAVLGGLIGGVAATAIFQGIHQLQQVIERFSKVFEDNAKLYTSALKSGGNSVGFAVNRSVLAQVMGVSEDEVYKFGAAMQFASRMTGTATEALAKTMPTLTATTWQYRATLISLKAAFSGLMVALSPFINFLLKAVQSLADFMSKNAWIWNMITFAAGISVLPGKNSQVPNPIASPDRMPASAWEKMGLIVGSGSSANYLQRIAANTERMVKVWENMPAPTYSATPTQNNPTVPRSGSGSLMLSPGYSAP